MVTPKYAPIEGKSVSRAGELEEYEDVLGDTKLEDRFCGGGDEELGDGVKYVKDGGWI